jgi:hypothetical protein
VNYLVLHAFEEASTDPFADSTAELRLATWTFVFNTDDESIACRNDSIGLPMTLFGNITYPGCHTFSQMFNAGQSCNPNIEGCNYDFMLPDPSTSGYDPAANYSRVYFNQGPRRRNDTSGDMAVRIYENENCSDESEEPWFQWSSCGDALSGCTSLPYSIGSIYVSGGEDSGSGGSCQSGAVEGVGTRTASLPVLAVLVIAAMAGCSLT